MMSRRFLWLGDRCDTHVVPPSDHPEQEAESALPGIQFAVTRVPSATLFGGWRITASPSPSPSKT